MISTKSLQSPIDPEKDGFRILVARFRGRGVEKSRCDVWMASLGPTEELLRRFQERDLDWAEFSRRYEEELFADSDLDDHNASIKNHGQKFTLRLLKALGARQNLTLLCHCPENTPHCHRDLLLRVLESDAV